MIFFCSFTYSNSDVPAQSKAHQSLRLLGHNHWETITTGFIDDALQLLDRQVVLRQHRQRRVAAPGPHHVSGQRGVRELLLGVQEGVSVQTDMSLVDSLAAERVAHPFAGHDGGHEGDDVFQAAGQFEHDDHQ